MIDKAKNNKTKRNEVSFRYSFIATGLAVLALCFLIASLTWFSVLALFGAAGLAWGLWSSFAEARRESKANIYPLPAQTLPQ